MADLSTLILAIIVVFNIVISLWNAYASGLTWTLLRGVPGQRLAKAAAVAGVALAFAGMAYSLLLILSFAALYVGALSLSDVLFVVSFDFLVFGAMIIGFGVVVTAQSVAIAVHQRDWKSVVLAVFNVFSMIWDVTVYAEGFKDAASVVSAERDRRSLYAFIAVAVGIAFIITWVAFRHGVRRGEQINDAGPARSPSSGVEPSAASPARPAGSLNVRRSHVLAAIAIVVVVVVVLGLIAVVAPGRSSSPKVHVGFIHVWAPDNVCGLGANPRGYAGFDDGTGASVPFSLEVRNFNASDCTVHGVTTNSSGFGLSNVATPVTVHGGQNGTLNLTVLLPGSPFSGDLNLVYS